MELLQLTATTLSGLESILADELRSFGARDVKEGRRAVFFKGDLGTVYKVNFRSRFALRILKPIKEFEANSEKVFYTLIHSYPWEEVIAGDRTFAIRTVVSSEIFTHSKFMALKAKDAIVDRIRDKTGERPDVNVESPDIPIHIHIRGRSVTISLDSTGISLHKRGYRQLAGQAPLNEVLAAGIVELSGWDITTQLYDAMCGSGTISIEAAIKGLNIPPGMFREHGYAFESWPDFDKALLDRVAETSFERIRDIRLQIFASDISRNAISKAKKNIYAAELEDEITASVEDFLQLRPETSRGTLIINPPYGERMDREDIDALYSKIGDAFKQNFRGYSCFLITANLGALKKVGLRSTSRKELFNGPLECRLARFDIYEGSRRR